MFKPKYYTKETKNYQDMMSDNIEDRFRCDLSFCIYSRGCPYYHDIDDATTNFIHFNFRKKNLCPRQDGKIGYNFMQVNLYKTKEEI